MVVRLVLRRRKAGWAVMAMVPALIDPACVIDEPAGRAADLGLQGTGVPFDVVPGDQALGPHDSLVTPIVVAREGRDRGQGCQQDRCREPSSHERTSLRSFTPW